MIERFPKRQKYQLGLKLADISQDFVDNIIRANFTRSFATRSSLLDQLSGQLFTLRLKIRMAKDLKAISLGKFAELNERLEDIQRQLSGWRKWTQSKLDS